MKDGQIHIAVDWRYCIAFYFVVMLYASLHELMHHFAGFIACGAWGDKTFNSFTTACEGTFGSWMATFAGPAFSFAAMWVGWWLLARKRSTALHRQMGFAIVFAQLPLQRMTGPLLQLNDEYYAAGHFFGYTTGTMWATFAVICAFCVPPLIGAWRAIGNRRRAAWFLFYLVLFPYVLWGPIFGLLEYLLVSRDVLSGRTIGIANLFILNEIVTIVGHVATGSWLSNRPPNRRDKQATASYGP